MAQENIIDIVDSIGDSVFCHCRETLQSMLGGLPDKGSDEAGALKLAIMLIHCENARRIEALREMRSGPDFDPFTDPPPPRP